MILGRYRLFLVLWVKTRTVKLCFLYNTIHCTSLIFNQFCWTLICASNKYSFFLFINVYFCNTIQNDFEYRNWMMKNLQDVFVCKKIFKRFKQARLNRYHHLL